MPKVSLHIASLVGPGETPAERTTLTVAPAYAFVDGTAINWPVPVTVDLVNGEGTVTDMETTYIGEPLVWAFRLSFENGRGGVIGSYSATKTFPVGATGTVEYADMIDVDPVADVPGYGPTWAEQAKADALLAETARDEAVAAKNAAVAVGTTNDTIMAGRINTPGSATDIALKNSYVTPERLSLDSVSVLPRARHTARPLLVLTFDDGWIQDYTVVRPILNARGIKATFCIVTTYPGGTNRTTWAQIAELAADGHEIIAHSRNHNDLSAADEATLTSEVDGSIADLRARGYASRGFIWPFNASSAAGRKHVLDSGCEYAFGQNLESQTNDRPFRTFSLGRQGIGADAAAGQAIINATVAAKNICATLIHSTDFAGTDLAARLELFIDYAIAQGVQILTASEAADLTKPIQSAGDWPYNSGFVIDDQGAATLFKEGLLRQATSTLNWQATRPPSDWPINRFSTLSINSGTGLTEGWPAAGPATVWTDKIQTSSAAYYLQTFIGNGSMFTRRATSDTVWGAWSRVGPISYSESSSTTAQDAIPTSWAGGVSMRRISSSAVGLPNSNGGQLVVFMTSVTAGAYNMNFQLFVGALGTGTWIRSSTADGSAWGAWRRIVEAPASGTAAPTSTPAYVGQQFVDTTGKKVYSATGTASAADWTVLN